MAIAFDAASSAGVAGNTVLTYSHTCTGSDLALVVEVATNELESISSITYNGVALTQIDTEPTASGQVFLWLLIGPDTGAHDIVVTRTGVGTWNSSAASYTGVKQTGQPDNFGSANGSSPKTSSLTPIADNCWMVLGAVNDSGADVTASTGATRRAFNSNNMSGGIFDNNAAITPPGANSMTTTAASGNIGHAYLSLAPAVAAGVSVTRRRMMTGIGT